MNRRRLPKTLLVIPRASGSTSEARIVQFKVISQKKVHQESQTANIRILSDGCNECSYLDGAEPVH